MGDQNAQRSLRVAMFIQEYPPIIGGAEQQLAAQAGVLADLGVDVQVLTRRWWPELRPFEVMGGASVFRLPAGGPKALAAVQYIFAALWKTFRLRPDVLHAHELLSPASAAILAKWLVHRPVVATVLRGGLLGDVGKIQRGPLGKLRTRIVVDSVDLFIVISGEIDSELAAVGVPDAKRVFIPNGVDAHRFAPASDEEKRNIRLECGLPDGKLVIFTGRLEREKQIDQLLTLWPRLMAEVPDAHLLVLGKGSLERELQAQNVTQVHFLGGASDVAPYLRAADVFVLPSLTEGLSVSMLEAMSCGLPALVTRVGGAADVITDREDGWLIPPGEPEALLSALRILLKDEQMRRSMASRGRQRILENYALRPIVEQVRTVYERVSRR